MVQRLARFGARPFRFLAARWILSAILISAVARADVQFDVFMGYDGASLSVGWMPAVCEVFNDGPSFVGEFELTAVGAEETVTRRMTIELPTQTRKRFVIPVFSVSKFSYWRARLLDERGRERAIVDNLRPSKELAWSTPILGVLGKGLIRVPEFPAIKAEQRKDLQPVASRMQATLFPDNPLALDSLTALYLNSAMALDLNPGQARAIYAWVERGGHLIVGVDQPSDISASPWLEQTLPMRLKGVGQITIGAAFDEWLVAPWRSASADLGGADRPGAERESNAARRVFHGLGSDPGFDTKTVLAALGTVTDGTVTAGTAEAPLIVEARRGYGRVTLLTFNPDLNPFLGWKNQPWFWLKLLHPRMALYDTTDFNVPAGSSLDALVASMIETKQVRKLPVFWLLAILVVYLFVIGPFDWFTLKKLKRQMLTWITFPIYVALFSGLIYFIGFKLRAGKVEWNDLSVIDIWPQGQNALLSGRTYASIYSPGNDHYKIGGEQPISAIRGEYAGKWNNGEEIVQGEIRLSANRAEASGFVPIWTSRLFVTDWLDSAPVPLALSAQRGAGVWRVKIENRMDHPVTGARLAIGERIYSLADIPARGALETNLVQTAGVALYQFVAGQRGAIDAAINRRQSAFGQMAQAGDIDVPACLAAASFTPDQTATEPQQSFMIRDHLVIGPDARQGEAVLVAWDDKAALARPLARFSPSMQTRRNLLRLASPVAESAP
jgi:hypothetical protein